MLRSIGKENGCDGALWAEGEAGSRGRVAAPDLELTVDQCASQARILTSAFTIYCLKLNISYDPVLFSRWDIDLNCS